MQNSDFVVMQKSDFDNEQGCLESLKRCITPENVNYPLLNFEHSPTVLYVAVSCNFSKCVSWLIQERADVNARRSFKAETPLFAAVYNANTCTTQLLLRSKASPNARNNSGIWGKTPLDVAIARNPFVRYKEDFNSPWYGRNRIMNYRDGFTINDGEHTQHRLIVHVITQLLWYGANQIEKDSEIEVPHWIYQFMTRRKVCRESVIVLIGIRSHRCSILDTNTRDVIVEYIAKTVWTKQFDETWKIHIK